MNKFGVIKTGIKNMLYMILSQGFYLGLSIITSFLLPKFLGVTEFAYWQIYLFYINYVGFFHFGFIDGMYLRYGHKDYIELPYDIFRSSFRIFTVILVIIMVLFNVALIFETNIDKRFALRGVDISIIIVCMQTYFTYILQFTNQIKRYSISTVSNRLLFTILICVLFITKTNEFEYVIIFDLLSRLIVLIICGYWCKDIVFGKGTGIKKGIKEVLINIKVGINLMLANIMGMLITGIGRFMVERFMSVEEFGLYSFANTATQLVLTFINAISLVIYPMLKRMDKKEVSYLYNRINTILCFVIFVGLMLYFPIYLIVVYFLPSYNSILNYLYILFPIVIANGKISIIINTYYKALRKEKMMFKMNLICIFFFLILAVPIFFRFSSVKLLSICTLIVMLVLCYGSEIYLKKKMNIENFKNIMEELLLIIGFLFFTNLKQLFISFIGYGFLLILYLSAHYKEIIYYVKRITKLLKTN